MVPCSSCGTFVLLGEGGCPHCGATVRTAPNVSRAAALLGLVMVACTGGDKDSTTDTGSNPQPLYGVTTSDTPTDADTDADTDSDTDTDTDTDSDTDTDTDTDADTDTGAVTTGGSGATVEPLYGVTTTGGSGTVSGGTLVEPLYGVVTSSGSGTK